VVAQAEVLLVQLYPVVLVVELLITHTQQDQEIHLLLVLLKEIMAP
tara:strand:- start:328 stop:465 length:138 start_codon:yes stop_codon:yes gene_type:complete